MKTNIKAGDTIKVAGKKWDVLEVFENGYLCLLHEVLPERQPFSRNGNNDWKCSDIREWLNREFIKELPKEQFLPIMRGLMAEDGLKDYGVCCDRVTLLTCNDYRTYREYITPVKDWWWTLTADSPINFYVKFVGADGALRSSYTHEDYIGVRPVCFFKNIKGENCEEKEKV